MKTLKTLHAMFLERLRFFLNTLWRGVVFAVIAGPIVGTFIYYWEFAIAFFIGAATSIFAVYMIRPENKKDFTLQAKHLFDEWLWHS